MSSLLLQTKLRPPVGRSDLLRRPRLLSRLALALPGKVTVVSAPPGFGKTVTVAQWLAEDGLPFAWLSLDESDNDPSRFVNYLIAALDRVEPMLVKGLAVAGQPGRGRRLEPILTAIINRLEAWEAGALADPLARPLVLVLDDYHLVQASAVHEVVSFLIDHQSGNLHIVLVSRSEPALPLARLRASGQLTEVGQAELAFTLEEAEVFLNELMAVKVGRAELARLLERTEGWPVGLQLAAASLQGREPAQAGAFIAAFAGSHRYVMDFLVEEVLARQETGVRDFLLDTSILEALSGPLCSAVTGRTDAQSVLAQMERNNLFVVPLDEERRWYRYHRLMADLLRRRLDEQHPDRAAALHARASDWYERNGLPSPAIEHAVSAGQMERAAQLIEAAAEPTLMRSEIATFHRWSQRLPEALIRARPRLAAYCGGALLMGGGSLEKALAWLDVADSASGPEQAALGEAAAFRAALTTLQGKADEALAWCRRALQLLPENSHFLRGLTAEQVGMVYLTQGDLAAAMAHLQDGAQRALLAGNIMAASASMANVAGLAMLSGRLGEAKALYQQAVTLAGQDPGPPLPVAGKALMGLAELSRERNELEAARAYLGQGLQLASQYAEVTAIAGYCTLAMLEQVAGRHTTAQEALSRARGIAQRFEASDLDDRLVDIAEVRIMVMQAADDPAARLWLERWAASWPAAAEDAPVGMFYDLYETEQLNLARAMLALDQAAEAADIVESLLPLARKRQRVKRIIESLNIRALALGALGQEVEAQSSLAEALALGMVAGFVRAYVDEGKPMSRLLHTFLKNRGKDPTELDAFARKLLTAAGQPDTSAPPAELADSGLLVEPLTTRELEVLALIALGRTNQEIADELYLSLSTVKGHASHVYAKLQVTNRTEAVDRARRLGLLDE